MKKIFILLAALSLAAVASAQEPITMYVMKQGKIDYQSVVSDIDSIIFYNPLAEPPIDPSTVDEGVIINGVKWATRNVAAPGHFADNREDSGMFYQWNRNVGWSAWSTTYPLVNSNGGTTWDHSYATGTIWETTNNVCPAGYRIPTRTELQSLVDAGSTWTTLNGVNGRVFGSDNTIFLPAARSVCSSNESFWPGDVNTGGYWSSTGYDEYDTVYAYFLDFHSENARLNYLYRSFGFCVRCVAE